jgi:hypothetical protein
LFSLDRMSAASIYRILIALRGCWLLVEWLFGWGVFSKVTTFSLTHPYATLVTQFIGVAFWLAILSGMVLFQRWARLIFVVLLGVGFLRSLFQVQRYSLSSPPSFVIPVSVLMLLVTGAIVAMSFLPPVRDCFAVEEV